MLTNSTVKHSITCTSDCKTGGLAITDRTCILETEIWSQTQHNVDVRSIHLCGKCEEHLSSDGITKHTL